MERANGMSRSDMRKAHEKRIANYSVRIDALEVDMYIINRDLGDETPETQADIARERSISRLNSGGTMRFVYHEYSNREPVDRIVREANATGQQDLGLFVEPTIWVWGQKK